MPTKIKVRDESVSGKTVRQFEFEVPAEFVSVRELIRSRVYQEVKDFNVQLKAEPEIRYCGLVEPPVERLLNGELDRTVDWQKQLDRAIDSFRRGQIIILVNERQVVSLEEQIAIDSETSICFLCLALLAGG